MCYFKGNSNEAYLMYSYVDPELQVANYVMVFHIQHRKIKKQF